MVIEAGCDFHPDAEGDLKDIWKFGAERWSVTQADEYLTGLLDRIEAFATGQFTTARRTEDRRFAVLRYETHHIYLAATSERWEVVRVLHQRMDADQHL